MNKQPLSIFKDVIGPVMRGPSSSHTAASVRIGQLVRQFMQGKCRSYSVEFETKGSLATTYSSQGSDIGLVGGLPGTLLAAADELALSDHTGLEGLLAAGLIGVLIASQSTFAAEECGCQAECGSGPAMTAAALVQIAGGTVQQAPDAAAIALQNIMGLVCDPVANRVEVPCLGKNVLAGMNAIASADMTLAGYDPVIPLDETIAAFDQVGRMLPAELRCTGKAGFSTTPTSQALANRLNRGLPH